MSKVQNNLILHYKNVYLDKGIPLLLLDLKYFTEKTCERTFYVSKSEITEYLKKELIKDELKK
jgi:hypothetical protein